MPDPTITISCLHYEWETVDEAFARCREEFGLDGVEFSLPHPKLDEAALERVRVLAQGTGMETSVHFWGDLAQMGVGAAVGQLRQWLAVCEAVGFAKMIIHGGSHDDRRLGIAITRQALAEVAGDYERAGVMICLENHYAWEYHDCHELFSTPEELLEVLPVVDNPAVRFCLDYGHSQMTSNTEEFLERLAPWLAYVHLADNMGVDDDHLAFGEGVVPWRQVLSKTRAVGYPGPFTVEFPVREGRYHRLGECVAMLREVYEAPQA